MYIAPIIGSFISALVSSITYSCLSSLSLSNFVWDDVRVDPQVVVPETIFFIVRHGRTLKKLKLDSCTICVQSDRPTLLPTLVRSWAAVWNRFAEELTQELTELVDLVMVSYYLPEYGFGTNSAYLLHDIEQDTPAFEDLVTMTKGWMRLTSLNSD